MSEIRSTRHILRATGIIGAASLINMTVAALRMKVVAIALGADGLGRIGILVSLMNTASAGAAWGISNSGARALAAASTGEEVAAARRALFGASFVLGALGAAIIFVSRIALARWLFNDVAAARAIGWTGVAVGLSVIALAQNGFLTGSKRVGDLARISAVAAVITTLLTVPLVLALRAEAIVPYVVLGPIVTTAAGAYFILRVSKPADRPKLRSVAAQWRDMALFGTSLTGASFAILGGQLAMRVVVRHALGPQALGLFQATFAISAMYVGLALGALSTDYYPRLVPHVGDAPTLRRLVNGQVQVSLLLAAPLIILAIGFAPSLIALMYAPSFRPAAEMLRWQMMGDLMKIAGLPLSFILLASGRGVVFAVNEAAAIATGVAITALLVPAVGLVGAGVAYFIMYAAYLVSLTWLVQRHTGTVWELQTLRLWLLVTITAILTFVLSKLSGTAGMIFAFGGSAGLGVLALRRLGGSIPPWLPSFLTGKGSRETKS